MSRLQPSFDVSTCRRWLCVGLPVAFALAVTAAAFWFARNSEHSHVRGHFEQVANLLAADLIRNLDACEEILHAIRSFYDSSDNVTPEEFHSFAQRDYVRRPGIQSLKWVPRVPHDQRAAFEQTAREAGLAGFRFKRWMPEKKWIATDDAWADEYYPVYFIEPHAGNESRAGIDLGSKLTMNEALQQARDSGELLALPRFAEDEEPDAVPQDEFLLFIPIYGKGAKTTTAAQRHESLLGFAAGVFRTDDIVSESLAGREDQDVKLRIIDIAAPVGGHILFDENQSTDQSTDHPRVTDLQYSVEHEIGGRPWRLDFTAAPGYVAVRRKWAPWMVLGGGLLLTVTLGGLLQTITGRAAKVQQLVEERTAALERSRADLQLAADREKSRKAELDFAYLAAGQHADTGGERATILRQTGEESVGLESFDAILDAWAWQARNLIGAHQSGVSYFPHGNIAEGIHAISLSDKYEKYRSYDVLPTGDGIWKLVVSDKLSFCMTDEQLQSHPAWKNFSDLLDERGLEHPPMRGWLAVPVLSHDHKFIGLLQLSDKYEGEFTQDDLQRLSRLAQLMAPTFSLQYANEELHRRNLELGNAKDALELSNIELQQFAYIASHDLQTPLRSIAAFAQFLQKDYEGRLDGQADDYIDRMVGGVKRMQKLISDLLAYSRVGSRTAPFVAVDLNQLCDDVAVLLHTSMEDAGGRITHDPLPTVVGDRSQLSQLLQNLIENALKYRHEDPPRIHLSAEQNGSAWQISVCDNGIGIDVKHHEQIFEVFRRLHTEREYPGTGIGLAICRRIVQRHGGQLWLESEPGKGSTFYFTIPECSHEEQVS